MSSTAQAKAARRKAQHDERYIGRARKDAATSRNREIAKVRREMERRMRKGKK